VRAANGLVHLPSGAEIRVGVRAPDGTEHWEMRWRQMARLGPLREDGDVREGAALFRVGDALFEFTFRAKGGGLSVMFVARNGPALACTPLVRRQDPWSAHGYHTVGSVPPDGPAAYPVWDGAFDVSGAGLDVNVRIAADTRSEVMRPPYLTGDLEEAMWRGVAWNTIWQPRLKRLMTPVSRDWCVDDNNFGDYVLFPWDTFFCALLAARRDEQLAYDNVRAVLGEMTDRGMLPNVGGGAGKTLDRSQPPVAAFCVWRLFEQFGNRDFLAEVYPLLARWHAFWMKYRDGNGDGLLEWGSDPIPAPVDWWKPHTQQAAKWESGLDNSPMYENIAFNESANTLELADVGLTCLYAADAEALAKMADVLGKPEEARAYREEYEALKSRINDRMWDEERGLYVNRHWDGRLATRYSPTSFYPLYAGVATPERAERSVREHLLNPDEFWGEWVIPSISRQDPNFRVQKYWQGRVWPPMNFLVYTGLRRYGLDEAADELAAKSAALFLKEWREEGHIHENFNAITADGDDVDPADPEGSSDPIYTWGGLLALIALDAGAGSQEETEDGR
jgi:hypothetical protein